MDFETMNPLNFFFHNSNNNYHQHYINDLIKFDRFRMHTFLPYYYSIKGYCKDGFTYVLYINGGHPPWTLLGKIFHLIVRNMYDSSLRADIRLLDLHFRSHLCFFFLIKSQIAPFSFIAIHFNAFDHKYFAWNSLCFPG